MEPAPVQLDIYRTAIPMRSFEHAAAARELAEAIVVRMELSDGTVGWGETLPREYVTGETLETVPRDIEAVLWPAARAGDAKGRDLPAADGDRPITAARCAVELARYNAWLRWDWRRVGPSGARIDGRGFPAVRVSGVLGASTPARTSKHVQLMRLYGVRDFKLKLGLGDDADAGNLRVVKRWIGRAVQRGRCTLRVDVNGGWSADETPDRVAALKPHGVCVVEQPVFMPAEGLIELAQRCELPLMADESLITEADAEKFGEAPGRKVWLNIRLSKNGGLWPSLSIAEAAGQAGIPFTAGCMVGESSILSAAQRQFLWACGPARFVEGNYGKLLLLDDLTRRSVRCGYGGVLKRPYGRKGPAADPVDPQRLARYGELIKTLGA